MNTHIFHVMFRPRYYVYYSDLMTNMYSRFLFLRPYNKLMVGIFNMYRILKWKFKIVDIAYRPVCTK